MTSSTSSTSPNPSAVVKVSAPVNPQGDTVSAAFLIDRTLPADTPLFTIPPEFSGSHESLRKALEFAYMQGWKEAARWGHRDDLMDDVDSPSYAAARIRNIGL